MQKKWSEFTLFRVFFTDEARRRGKLKFGLRTFLKPEAQTESPFSVESQNGKESRHLSLAKSIGLET